MDRMHTPYSTQQALSRANVTEESARATWSRDSKVREEFVTFECYFGYLRHEAVRAASNGSRG